MPRKKGPIGRIRDHIGQNWLTLSCKNCQNSKTFDPIDLALAYGGEDVPLADLVRRAKCRRCGHKGAALTVRPGSNEYGGPPRMQ